jgi:hypothetical protein
VPSLARGKILSATKTTLVGCSWLSRFHDPSKQNIRRFGGSFCGANTAWLFAGILSVGAALRAMVALIPLHGQMPCM